MRHGSQSIDMNSVVPRHTISTASKKSSSVRVSGAATSTSQSSQQQHSTSQFLPQPAAESPKARAKQPAKQNSGSSSLSQSDRGNPRIEWMKRKCRVLSDNWKFVVLTTTLTIYALFGDDFRLATTHKQMDILFNCLTIFSCIVFTVEIVVASFGQAEYFMGFFFFLDVGSTATLIMDLTWISNALFCTADDSQGALRTSRAGRAGARASRTVRIIRLMRLAKLYKAYKTNVESKKAAEAARLKAEVEKANRSSHSSVLAPGGEQEDWPADNVVEEDEPPRTSMSGSYQLDGSSFLIEDEGESGKNGAQQGGDDDEPDAAESRVGKKLSDMTTRRVIILVLVMLIVMPQFTPSTNSFQAFQEFLYSSNFGADVIQDRWRTFCGGEVSETTSYDTAGFSSHLWCLESLSAYTDDTKLKTRAWFERSLIDYMYRHHAGSQAWKLFWIGANSTTMPLPTDSGYDDRVEKAQAFLGDFMQLNQAKFVGDYAQESDNWDDLYTGGGGWDETIVPLSEAVRERMQSPWTEVCSSHVGFAVQPEVQALTPTGCSTTQELRCSEREFVTPMFLSEKEGTEFSLLFTFDSRSETTLEAGLNIMQTIFICFAVGLGAMSFSKDANELLLNPIERMIAKMETIKDNPLQAMRLGDLEYRREEVEQAKKKDALAKMSRVKRVFFHQMYMKKVKEPMETVMLEKTIIKLGGLLALGFGEAGAEVAGRFAGSGTGIRENTPGMLVDCAFGFAALRNFNRVLEALKEKTMIFVNQVSEVVHGCCDDWHGAPNKNLGDAFMIVWRLSTAPADRQTKLADMAVMAFVKIVAEINKSRVLAQYRSHPGLLQRQRNFRVCMGFGLHIGWAVEGAIGSEYKIDATYLSPNVHVAHRLQLCTTNYGVDIALSDTMASFCSKDLTTQCRLIDHVTVKGARAPIRLYTVDLDGSALAVVTHGKEPISRNRYRIRQLREVRKNEKWSEDIIVPELLASDEDIVTMRAKYTKEFFHRFSMGYRNYEAGEWLAARDMFFTCHYQPKPDIGRHPVTSEEHWPVDGPSQMLLRYMQQFDYEPPEDWSGYRALPLLPEQR